MILGSIGEWIIGNTFPFVVFGTFGMHYTTFPLHAAEPRLIALSRFFLGHFRSHSRPLVQRIRCLRASPCRKRRYPSRQSRQPSRASITSFQLEFRLLPGLYG